MRTRDHRRRPATSVAAGILAAGLALAGCSASSGSNSSAAGAPRAAAGAAGSGAGGSQAQPKSGTAGGAPSSAPSPGATGAAASNRSVIYSGEIQLRSAHVDAAVQQAQTLVRSVGGYIDSEQVGDATTMPWYGGVASDSGSGSDSGTVQPTPLAPPSDASGEAAVLELRVPSASYDAVFTQLSSLGAVLARERASQDVTEQVVDLDARITSEKASLERLDALMKQAGSLNDLLTLEQAVTQRESDLNSLESQVASLQSQVAMSTVTVELFQTATPHPSAKPKPSGAWGAAGHALGAGWHGLYLVGRGLLVAISAGLPFLVLFALLGYGTYRFSRRRKGKPEADEE
ncbi:DUF4349 domain-containing protein [Streptacidiphilus melanogenes]|uniref:DUF4349 domain-containing protein n=1 Tax=Streptacidiphilus melanogenes TaxID=411235 RepID=UPI0009FF4F7E|nr:DUF4349 domain-containing protein [Streptacidiphilus melanogenes]